MSQNLDTDFEWQTRLVTSDRTKVFYIKRTFTNINNKFRRLCTTSALLLDQCIDFKLLKIFLCQSQISVDVKLDFAFAVQFYNFAAYEVAGKRLEAAENFRL